MANTSITIYIKATDVLHVIVVIATFKIQTLTWELQENYVHVHEMKVTFCFHVYAADMAHNE